MNTRERFRATCAFEPLDRPIRFEAWGFWQETIKRWHGEGLPEAVIDSIFTAPDYFGFDKLSWLPICANTDYEVGFFPTFTEEVIEKTDAYTIMKDIGGKTVKVFSDGRSTIPHYLDHPVKNIADLEELKWRLDPETPERFTALLDAMIALAEGFGENTFSAALVCGLFGTLRHLMGLKNLSVATRRDPALIHTIARHWAFMNATLVKKIRRKTTVDFVFLWEDMAYKNGPMISPAAFQEFMAPYYRELIGSVRADTDIENFCVDSDGDVTLLIPLFMETGVNMMLPFEVQSGMDILKVRREFPSLVIWGGIDKRALFHDEGDIRREVAGKVPAMLEKGGYIPSIDHNVPPEVSLENFRIFLDVIRTIEK